MLSAEHRYYFGVIIMVHSRFASIELLQQYGIRKPYRRNLNLLMQHKLLSDTIFPGAYSPSVVHFLNVI